VRVLMALLLLTACGKEYAVCRDFNAEEVHLCDSQGNRVRGVTNFGTEGRKPWLRN
jgi:hypothetical protein